MLYISKHAAIDGQVPDSIQEGAIECIRRGLCVNFNLWITGGRTTVGWDGPEEILDITKIPNTHILACAMNPAAFEFCLKHGIHCYYNTDSAFSLTSKGIPLSMGSAVLEGSIIMNPEECLGTFEHAVGICSRYIMGYMT